MTAVYKGTPKNGNSILLRSYDSRREPAPEFNCTIWQAGRATAATGLAFKPIQIGQSVFIDEGAGKYNPAPQIMDEACVNEWPGREIGVFVSIGTGKRPPGTNKQQHEWWEGFVGGGMGDFAEARRRLISKIEGCEETHQYMQNEHLAKRGVNPDNYYRLNVEVGVGEFGMNEWSRLADISTSTRRYLAKPEVRQINEYAATKLARIERAKRRHVAYTTAGELDSRERLAQPVLPPLREPLAVELPGEELPQHPKPRPGPQYPVNPPHPYQQVTDTQDKFTVVSSDEYPQTVDGREERRSEEVPYRRSTEKYSIEDPRTWNGKLPSPRRSNEDGRSSPPPLPPKTPIQYMDPRDPRRYPAPPLRHNGMTKLPYPDTNGPPPAINMARKPEYTGR